MIQSGKSWAALSERRQFKEKSISVLSKIQDGVILTPCSQPRGGSTGGPGHQPVLVQWEESCLPRCIISPSSNKSMNTFWYAASPSFRVRSFQPKSADREDEGLGFLQQQGRTSSLVGFQVSIYINQSLALHIFYPFFATLFCKLLSLIKAPQHGFLSASIQWCLEVFWRAKY